MKNHKPSYPFRKARSQMCKQYLHHDDIKYLTRNINKSSRNSTCDKYMYIRTYKVRHHI